MKTKAWSWPVYVLLAAGCGAQATPDYQGEKLSVVQGLVVNELTAEAAEDAVVLAQWGQVGAMFPPGGTTAEIEGEFPAQFSLALYEMPGEDFLYNAAETIALAQNEHPFDPANEGRIAIAHIIAVGKDADGNPDPYNVLGGSTEHALLYAESDIEEGSYAAWLLHGTASAGYHLVELRELDADEERDVIECEAASESTEEWIDCGINSRVYLADPETEVTVRLATEGFDFPSYSQVYVGPGTDLNPPQPTCDDVMIPCD